MGSPPPPDLPSEKPSDPIAREQLDDLIELALEQRRAKAAKDDDVIDAATAEAIAAEVGVSPDEFAAARRILAKRRGHLRRVALGATAVGGILALGLWLATPALPPEAPVPSASGSAADRAYKLRQDGDRLRKQDSRYWEALKLYRQAVALTPNDCNAWNDLGIGFKAVGDFAKAETAYRKAIALAGNRPDGSYPYYNLANLLDEGPRRLESIPLYQEASRLRPFSPDTYNNLGVLYERLGRYDEAMTLYRKSFTVNPSYERGRRNLKALQLAVAKPTPPSGSAPPR